MTPTRAYGPDEPPQCAMCGQRKLHAAGGPWLSCDGKVYVHGTRARKRCGAKHYAMHGEHGTLAVAYVHRDLYDAARNASPADANDLLAKVMEAATRALSEVSDDRAEHPKAA